MDLSTEGMLIIRTLAYALRHNPSQFNLELDAEGWTSVDQLVSELRFARYDWALIDWPRIERTIRGSDRFEVRNGMIRASYGHSVHLDSPPILDKPPEFLFHGTAEDLVPKIMDKGLLRMGRRFVHLSSDLDWVKRFLSTKPRWAVVRVRAGDAHKNEFCFRRANAHVWLAESVPPRFLDVVFSGHGLEAYRIGGTPAGDRLATSSPTLGS